MMSLHIFPNYQEQTWTQDTFFKNQTIKTFWGEEMPVTEQEKCLIESEIMNRIKLVDQSGPMRYFFPDSIPAFSRYDHSIGVWALVKKFSPCKLEHYTALLHDVSHTAFSHFSDFLTKGSEKNANQNSSFQDTIHIDYLNKSTICTKICEENRITVELLNPDNKLYSCLERPLPDLCADRIEYNIHTALLMNRITQEQTNTIISDLRFENGAWFFTNRTSARIFAEQSLYFTQNFWSSRFENPYSWI